MSDDLTQRLPGDKEPIAPQDDDRMSVLIRAVQSLSSDIQEVKVRIGALEKTVTELEKTVTELEKTVTERSYETKPIWERALAEIAATRAELAETRAELRAEMKDGFRKLGAKMEVLNEDLLTLRADQRLDRRVETLESKTP